MSLRVGRNWKLYTSEKLLATWFLLRKCVFVDHCTQHELNFGNRNTLKWWATKMSMSIVLKNCRSVFDSLIERKLKIEFGPNHLLFINFHSKTRTNRYLQSALENDSFSALFLESKTDYDRLKAYKGLIAFLS